MITVMGATGHTGKKVTEALLKAGEKVRALVEMTRAFNEKVIKPRRTPENITATRFEDFAGELARAYASA